MTGSVLVVVTHCFFLSSIFWFLNYYIHSRSGNKCYLYVVPFQESIFLKRKIVEKS